VDHNKESDKDAEFFTEESVAGAMANVKEMAKGAKKSAEGAKESANMTLSNAAERFRGKMVFQFSNLGSSLNFRFLIEFGQSMKKLNEKSDVHQASGKGRGRLMFAVDYNTESDKEAEVSTEESVAGAMANVKEMAKGAKESAEGAKESANMSLSNVAERLQGKIVFQYSNLGSSLNFRFLIEFGQSMKKSTEKSNVHQASGKGHGRLMFAVDYNTESWRLHLPSVV
jgi:hypothetical protein